MARPFTKAGSHAWEIKYRESGRHSAAHANKGLAVAKSNVQSPKVTYRAKNVAHREGQIGLAFCNSQSDVRWSRLLQIQINKNLASGS